MEYTKRRNACQLPNLTRVTRPPLSLSLDRFHQPPPPLAGRHCLAAARRPGPIHATTSPAEAASPRRHPGSPEALAAHLPVLRLWQIGACGVEPRPRAWLARRHACVAAAIPSNM
jgi:hypothetical protein